MLHEPPAQGLDRRPTTVTDEHERDHAFAEALARSRLDAGPMPLKRHVAAFLDDLLGILFPQLSEEHAATEGEIGARLALARRDLRELARPLVGVEWEESRRRGIDVLIAVDVSKSMLARDVVPDRLTRATR